MKKYKGVIAFDFDGVIHSYDKGWHDGSIYGKANTEVLQLMQDLMDKGYPVFIFSTRSPWQIKSWMSEQYPWFGAMAYDMEYDRHFQTGGREVKVIPFWKKFWNTTKYLGVTKRKLPATHYIDDRAVLFTGNVNELKKELPPTDRPPSRPQREEK